jgi:uroporphyrinogen-III synthase
MCTGAVDAVTFTSQPAVHHLFRIAERLGRADDLRAACNGAVLPVCVGPVCADAALAEGITRPRWPDPPRLAAMIRLVAAALSAPGPPVR